MSQNGELNPNWKGGKIKFCGYWYIYKPDHPFSKKQGYMAEHRLVMEQYLGRYLLASEIIHHKNGIKTDNRIENLEVTTYGKHILQHLIENPWTSGPKPCIMGFKNPKARKDVTVQGVEALRAKGMTLDDIAEILGCSRKAVWNRLKNPNMKSGEEVEYGIASN